MSENRTCSVDECINPHYAKGWCKAHYRKNRPPCKEEKCDKPSETRGWCTTHYMRWWKHGDASVALGRGGRPIQDRDASHRLCARCNKSKLIHEFGTFVDARGVIRHQSYCRTCMNENRKINRQREFAQDPIAAKARERASNLRRRYGPDIADWYETKFIEQRGRCAGCDKEPKSGQHLHVDHDHSCCSGNKICGKCLRGLLCNDCNRGFGLLKDSPVILARLLEYAARNSVSRPQSCTNAHPAPISD